MKMKSFFLWTLSLLVFAIAQNIVQPTEASAGNWQIYGATSMEMQTTVGGPNATDSITILNGASTSVSVTWSESISWLIGVSPGTTLTILPGKMGTFTATASPANLAAGTYYGTVKISGNGITQYVSASLRITTASSTTPVIGLSPTSLSFSAVVGGANPASQTLSITNTGGGTLTWSASRNATWLALSPISGTGNGSVTVSVNISNLQAGTYSGWITVSATGATTKTVPVSLTVTSQSTSTTGSASLTWNASTSTSVIGYKVYQRTATGTYSAAIAFLGNVTSYIASGLQKSTTYYFVVTAVDSSGKESLHSNEVGKTIY